MKERLKVKRVLRVGLLTMVLVLSLDLLSCRVGGSGDANQPAIRGLYVVNYGLETVSVYDASQTGDIAPLQSFGSLTQLGNPQFVAVDTVNNEIFVTNLTGNSVTVYGRTANGNVAPTRTISGENTRLGDPAFLAVTW